MKRISWCFAVDSSHGFGSVPAVTLAICLVLALMSSNAVSAATIFESGTLGSTGAMFADLANGTIPGTTVDRFDFPGVRFELTQPVVTSQVGGHFVQETAGTFFGAIVKLNDQNDFPNSSDLSTPDVLGVATFTFPNPSAEVFGDMTLALNPGWYALVFGSGLFGTSGSGGAVRNGVDIGDPAYIAYGRNLHWLNLDIYQSFFDNHRFVVKGSFVPEPNTLITIVMVLVVLSCFRLK